MARKNNENNEGNGSKGDDKEMFNALFREELDVQKKGAQRAALPEAVTREIKATRGDPEPPAQDELSETLALSTAERRILKIKPGLNDEDDTVKSFEAEEDQELQELIDTSPIWRYREEAIENFAPDADAKPGKRPHRLRTTLLALLLLSLGAFSVTYFEIVDLHKFMPLSEWKPTSVVKHQVVRKPAIPHTAEESASAKSPAPATPVKKSIVVREIPEPVTSAAPATPLEKSVDVNKQAEPVASKPEPAPEEIPPETAPLQEPARETQPPKWAEGSYPYSVYLGSYGTPERLDKAVNEYGSGGLSPYWVQVDLKKKGIWFRLFASAFETRGEADAFIKGNGIEGAFSRHTKYAVLIGTYRSEKEIHTERMELRAMGHSSYEVKAQGVFGLFSGAFFQVERAQKHKENLASKGIRGEVVER